MNGPVPEVIGFFDPRTFTISYLLIDPSTLSCAIIDPVLDYDPKSASTWTESVRRIIDVISERNLQPQWVLETHAHADHLTAASMLRDTFPGLRVGIGAQIKTVQSMFADVFDFESKFPTDGSQFDRLFQDAETFEIGNCQGSVLATPGHTPACISYCIGDCVFVGDTLFMPDYGTARADFPGGDSRTLFRSIGKLLNLPGATRLFMCHDYPPEDRSAQWECTVNEQRVGNIHAHDGVTEDDFVLMREARDARLELPTLMLPSIQVNIRGGEFPPPAGNGHRYLKFPVNAIGKARHD